MQAQLNPEALQAALASTDAALHAAQQAMLAELLLLYGGPLFALRPVPQVLVIQSINVSVMKHSPQYC